ncbi:MAG TPA: serine hydrolase [Ktedonobacteraceae bacterium]|nr:serine hydrolase [Ktedonobacteraceae bacterium]
MLTAIDQIVCQEIDLQGPGVAVAVVKEGKLVHSEGYGIANLEWNCPIRSDTVFCLASITKQFTATAIMLLEREGKLRLDDPITAYFPDYPTHDRTITITHLLNHTSGIKSYTSLDNFMSDISQKNLAPADLLAYFKYLPLVFEPGTRFLYNNSGYHLLGLIIEKIAGMSYGQFIQQRIFQPLGMHHSYYMHNEAIIPRRASGYATTPEGYRQAEYLNMMIVYAAGSLGSTVEDLTRWDAALREGRPLDVATQERMYTPLQLTDGRTEEYGFGFRVTSYEGHRLVGHGGGIPGFHTFLARFLDDKMMIVVLANASEIDVEKITRKIARHLFDLPAIARTPVTLSSAMLDKAVGTYIFADGSSLEIGRDEDTLTLRGPFEYSLLPTNEATFYASQDKEFTVQFADEQDGVFNALTLHIQMYRTFNATRKQQ